MASLISEKTSCATCSTASGLFTCRGCQAHFCTQHVAEHRQELGKQMDELILNHDRFQQNLNKQKTEVRQHSLIKQIDEWERQSIDMIRQAADDTRKRLQNTIYEHTTKLTNALTKISDELCKAREDDDFFETDLQRWMKKLDELKNDLNQPPNIKIEHDNDSIVSLITKALEVKSPKEIFKRSIGNIHIGDIGQVIVKKQDVDDASVRGSGEYSLGQHLFRFKIEECDTSKWIFIGIISRDVPMEAKSYKSPSSYGWAGGSQVYLNGVQQREYNGYKTNIEKNDILELFVNCNQQIIRLTNERTRIAYELQVDTSKCRFPWQLNFHLYWTNDRIRILQM